MAGLLMRDSGIFQAPPRYGKNSESDRELDGISSRDGCTIHVHPRFWLGPKDDAGRHLVPIGDIEILATDRESFEGEFPYGIKYHKLYHRAAVAEANPGTFSRSIGCLPMRTNHCALKGLKVASALSKDQTIIWRYGDSATGEECPISGQLGV
jgi:hypothetical protein